MYNRRTFLLKLDNKKVKLFIYECKNIKNIRKAKFCSVIKINKKEIYYDTIVLTTKPMCLSKTEVNKVSKLCAFKANGGDFLQIVRYRKDNILKIQEKEAIIVTGYKRFVKIQKTSFSGTLKNFILQ